MAIDETMPEAARQAREAEAPPRYDLIELLFFAYRDFVGEADAVLADYGFGRAHHRVLHFVDRNPGVRVSDLLAILKITKQSLGRVLRQLVEEGFVEARTGREDRREKLLFTTARGSALARRLARLQTRRIENALAGIEPGRHEDIAHFLARLVNARDRDEALARIGIGPADGKTASAPAAANGASARR